MTTATDKPTCHVRRHLTPSQFMTYDAMRGMAKPDDCGQLICYAKLITIVNHTSIGRTQNLQNITDLARLGWLIPEDKVRWRAGRFANNRFVVVEHADHDDGQPCPDFKFEAKTGANLKPDKDTKDFSINMAFARWLKAEDALMKLLKEEGVDRFLEHLTEKQRVTFVHKRR